MPRVYVDNAKNRQLGRVGMPLGSMPESKKATGCSDHRRTSPGCGQVAGSSASHRQAAGQYLSPDTYADNYQNQKLGRVGLPKGSMVVSKSGVRDQLTGRGNSAGRDSSPKTYADNYQNRKLGRVGLPKGSMVVSNSGDCEEAAEYMKKSPQSYVDIDERKRLNRDRIQRNGNPKSSSDFVPAMNEHPKVYVDNAQNRKLGRVGMPHGEAVVYKNSKNNPTPATKTSVYVDNPLNRRLGRVGLPIGTAVFSSKSKCIVQKNYDDTSINRKLGRVGKPRGCLPLQNKSKTTRQIPDMLKKIENGDDFSDYDFEDRGETSGDLEFGLLDSNGARIKAFDEAMYRHNRLQEEMSWKRKTATQDPPKTQIEILKDYKGKKIPFTEIKLRKVIGRGGFGQVYFAKWNETVVAVKKLQHEKISEARIRDFAEEVMKFCTLNHPNIVKFIGACIEKPNLCIVMEYMQMTLYDAIHIRNDTDFNYLEQIDIINQTCAGMNYLHSKRIAHCDLKTPNILLDYVQGEICEVKITDFGLSMIMHDTSVSVEELVKNIGTPRYSAPEMLRGEVLSAKDMMRADVYSLALVFLEVLFQAEPYPDYSYQQLKDEVGEKGEKPEMPSDHSIDGSIIDIMQKALGHNPLNRPSMSEIYDVVRTCKALYTN